MSLTISPIRAGQMAALGEMCHPIATWNDWASAAGTTIGSNRSAVADGALANAVNGGTYDFWMPDLSAATSATFTLNRAAAFTCNFVGIVAHNLGSIGGVTVTAEYSTTGGASWVSAGVSVTPADDGNIGLYFADIEAADWRLSMSGFTAGDDPFFGAITFGQALTFPRRIWQGYVPPLQATEVDLLGSVTEGGHYVGTAVTRRGRRTTLELDLLPHDWVRDTEFQAFQRRFNDGLPFWWAWRPMAFEELLYAWRSGGPIVPVNSGLKAFMSISAEVRAFDDA